MRNGAEKYGPFNWREKKVKATVYISAALRHINQFLDGEEIAEDSGATHLGHALACLGIILDAQETGNLVDDRPIPGAATKVIKRLTKKPEAKGFEPIRFSLKPGDSEIAVLEPEEDEAAQDEGFADAEARPEYVLAGPFGEQRRSVEDGTPGYPNPMRRNCAPEGAVDEADCDPTLRAARRGRETAQCAAFYQYGGGMPWTEHKGWAP